MRKIIATMLALTLTLGLTACGGTSDAPPPESNTPSSSDSVSGQASSTTPSQSSTSEHAGETALSSTPAQENSTPEASGKILIAYFSRMGNMDFDPEVDAVASATVQADGSEYVGNNKIIADMLAEKTGGDVFFIEQTEKYPAAYRATTDQVKEEQNIGARPALVAQVENMEQYSTVILVYPNWWGTLPPAVCTFLESYDFSEKTILPLATHEGSGLGSGPSEIESLCPDATLLEGLAVRGSAVKDAKASIDTWIEEAAIVTQSTDITMTVGETVITSTLDDSETSKAFLATLPRTISMSEYGEREYYGRIEAISEDGTPIPDFENGDVTYYPSGPSFAVFYANSDQSDLGGLIRMGKITSDLAEFEGLGASVEMQIAVAN